MSDFASSLPVRTESAGDIVAKIGDANVPSQQLAVSTEGEASVRVTKPLPSGENNIGDVDVLSLPGGLTGYAEDSAHISGHIGAMILAVRKDSVGSLADSDGDYAPLQVTSSGNLRASIPGNGTNGATTPSSSLLVAGTDGSNLKPVKVDTNGELQVDVLTQPARVASTDSISAWLLDESGVPFTEANPLPVYVSPEPGDPVHDYNTVSSVASGASSNHDYTVSAGKTLYVSKVIASASGKLKIEVQEETSAGSGTYTTKAVMFSSAAHHACIVEFAIPLEVESAKKIRVIRTNRDNQPQDVYSTIVGIER